MPIERQRQTDGGHPAFSDRVLVLNPVSGDSSHSTQVRDLAVDHGFSISETSESGDGVDLAADAARDGAEIVAACGGDGTINEVVRGLVEADALDDVTLAVVPAGTGNNFAGNLGIRSIEHAFEVIEEATQRRIDLGVASVPDGPTQPFVNSCIGGITAEASAATTPDSKDRLGILAYVVNTLQTLSEYDGMRLRVEAGGEDTWEGEAIFALVGNGRRFPVEGRTQADMEDGQFDVTIVEDKPTINLAGEAAIKRLFGGETANITQLQTPSLRLHVLDDTVQFSLDGEMVEANALDITTRPRSLGVFVGDEYDPDPD
ncbi:lipid kinase, YegS/Rv2252/BmrU family [Halogranum amylolyticum]|uniref:Lipid kinase, YegS/Rv2252/BmrU family n=1 Tax=Halogranum amylolyticum TaxID=660520 RepID=A0A1H8RID4_9EURY|nr:YegS/Rv2252/BmrU family lipid kinase [Halogranum amylolyticum]SEO65763.1 lipid kinase, YegS/Rv2252/BmrU family [Halogranum amylolyticum]